MLYFAYGSNMSPRRLARRSPDARRIGTGYIRGHILCVHKIGQDGSGKCDALFTGKQEDLVHGVLFELSLEDRNALDLAEGLGHGYVDRVVKVFDSSGNQHEAFTYIALVTNSELKPYCWYKEHLLRGAREGGLPPHYIAQLENLEFETDPDEERRKRELLVYKESTVS